MVMVSAKLNPRACWEFHGDIMVLHHPTTIATRYQAMVHCGSIRQTASITEMSAECLGTGDKARVKFRFVKHPEYLQEGQRLVFREGRTKAVGNVTQIIPYVPAVLGKDKTKQAAKQLQQVRGEGKRRTQQGAGGERGPSSLQGFSSLQDSGLTNASSIQGLAGSTN